MSFIFSRALAEEFSGATFLGGEQSAQSRGTPMPQAFLPRDKMMEFSRPSQSGMTFGPLTDDHGKDVLTSYLAAFPARTLVPPDEARASKVIALGSGQKWLASFAKYDHDSSLWKTAQCSLLGDSEEFSESLAAMGFNAEWGVLGAHHADAPHERERIWILADAGCKHGSARGINEQDESPAKWRKEASHHQRYCRWPAEPELDRVGHGVANRMDRLKAIGNGQVPRVAAAAFTILSGK